MRKKWICALIALVMLCGMALAEADRSVVFDAGFSMVLPEGWRYYPVDDEAAAQGVLYCMSDADGERWMYVQKWEDRCADMQALLTLVQESVDVAAAGIYSFGDTDFVVYEPTEGNVSCCAALLNGEILNFVVTPQNDADYMLTVTEIITSFAPAELPAE